MRVNPVLRAALFVTGSALALAPAHEDAAFVWREVGQADAPQEPRFTIRAGPIVRAEAAAVSGSFQVHRTAAPNGIPSQRLAGACLEFLAGDLGFAEMSAKQCQKNSDCSTPGENEFGACDTHTNQCWSRPAGFTAGAKLCNRGLIAPVNDVIQVPAEPVDVRQFGIKPGAHVRVGACLNKSGINPQVTGCQTSDGPDKIQVWGPVTRVR